MAYYSVMYRYAVKKLVARSLLQLKMYLFWTNSRNWTGA